MKTVSVSFCWVHHDFPSPLSSSPFWHVSSSGGCFDGEVLTTLGGKPVEEETAAEAAEVGRLWVEIRRIPGRISGE